MQRRVLGRTGLSVSQLSLGTVELGLDYGITSAGGHQKPDRTQAAALLHEALDLGINLIDTARAYGDAEEIIGEALQGRREEFVLLSKIAANRSEVRSAVESSLRALRTDRIDVMMIHCGSDADPDSDTAHELANLRAAGALRFIGASVYGERAALAAIESGWCDAIEIAYSPLDRRPESRTLTRAAECGVGVIARSVLLKGALTNRISTLRADFMPLQKSVRDLCEAVGTEPDGLPEIAYRYVMMTAPPDSALVGSKRVEELRRCITYVERGALCDDLAARIRSLPIPEARWLNPGLWPADQ